MQFIFRAYYHTTGSVKRDYSGARLAKKHLALFLIQPHALLSD